MTDFVESLASAITVRQLATPIDRAMVLSGSLSQSDAASSLADRDFDFAPVVDGGTVIGRIARVDLSVASEEPLSSFVTPLHDRIIVSASSPIDLVVEWFTSEPFLLVLDGRDIVGLVTVSDLNKQASRTYLYALVAGFEMALANMLRISVDDQGTILGYFTEKRRVSILGNYEAAGDQEADYIAAMNLSDLLTVARGAGISAAMGYHSRNSWEKETGSLVEFRNRVAHPTKPVVRGNADIDRVNRIIRSLRTLYTAAVQLADVPSSEIAD